MCETYELMMMLIKWCYYQILTHEKSTLCKVIIYHERFPTYDEHPIPQQIDA
jgi:hypothetical protein